MLSELLKKQQGPAPGAERPLPRAGSLYHRPGRRAGRGHHRHQHGRPRHRHPARRQPRDADAPRDCRASTAIRPSAKQARIERIRAEVGGQEEVVLAGRRALRHRHRAPREPAHRQPAARPLRPPGRSRRLALLPVARRRSDAHLRLRAHGSDAAAARPARRARRSSIPGSTRRWRRRSRRSRRATSNPQEPAEIRRRDERPAQGRLRAAPRAHGGDRRLRRPSPTCATRWSSAWSTGTSRRTPMPSSGTRKACTRRRCASSASTCRSSTGPRKRASPSSEIRERLTRRRRPQMAEKEERAASDGHAHRREEPAAAAPRPDWKDHLLSLDHLRQGIGLRAYGQRDPLNEYKREAFELFEDMLIAPARADHHRAGPYRGPRGAGAGSGTAAPAAAQPREPARTRRWPWSVQNPMQP